MKIYTVEGSGQLENVAMITVRDLALGNNRQGPRVMLGSGVGAKKKSGIFFTVPADGRWVYVQYKPSRHSCGRVSFSGKVKGIYTDTMANCKALAIMESVDNGYTFTKASFVHADGGAFSNNFADFLRWDMNPANCWAIFNTDYHYGGGDLGSSGKSAQKFLDGLQIPNNQRCVYHRDCGSFGVCADGRFGETDLRLSCRAPKPKRDDNLFEIAYFSSSG